MEDVPFATNRRIENCYLTIWGRAAISARMEHGLERERPEWCKKAKVFLFETILICVMRFVELCCGCEVGCQRSWCVVSLSFIRLIHYHHHHLSQSPPLCCYVLPPVQCCPVVLVCCCRLGCSSRRSTLLVDRPFLVLLLLLLGEDRCSLGRSLGSQHPSLKTQLL